MNNEIQFLQDNVQSEEVWKTDHDRAMKCTELEEKIKVGLSYFGLINGMDNLWSRKVQARTIPFKAEFADALHELYNWWISPCSDVFAAIAQFENEGYKVDGSTELRKAFQTVKQTLRTDVKEVIAGLQRVRGAA